MIVLVTRPYYTHTTVLLQSHNRTTVTRYCDMHNKNNERPLTPKSYSLQLTIRVSPATYINTPAAVNPSKPYRGSTTIPHQHPAARGMQAGARRHRPHPSPASQPSGRRGSNPRAGEAAPWCCWQARETQQAEGRVRRPAQRRTHTHAHTHRECLCAHISL